MRLTNDDLIEEFYDKNSSEFSDLTLEQFKSICYAPWGFLKREIESGGLPKIRFKYFGTFQVYKGRAQNMLYNLKQRFKFNKIDRKQYFEYKQMLEKYLSKIENEGKNNS